MITTAHSLALTAANTINTLYAIAAINATTKIHSTRNMRNGMVTRDVDMMTMVTKDVVMKIMEIEDVDTKITAIRVREKKTTDMTAMDMAEKVTDKIQNQE